MHVAVRRTIIVFIINLHLPDRQDGNLPTVRDLWNEGRVKTRSDGSIHGRFTASGDIIRRHGMFTCLEGGDRMIKLTAWACALALMTGTAASAASTKPAEKPVDTAAEMVARMDRNLDGKISFEEYRNAMVRRFDARDRNGDGVLEGDEYPKEWLAGADVQGATGKVSWDQFVAELQMVFDRFDGNKDGQLEAAEISAFAAARKAEEETRS
jgi:hypothetical protein